MTQLSTENQLEVTRHLKAPRERVFAAFSTMEAMKRWFGPKTDCEVRGEMDFRVGGKYRLTVNCEQSKTDADGCPSQNTVAGAYMEITPPERLVFTWVWQDDEDWAGKESIVTIELLPDGNETDLRLTQTGFPGPESRDRHSQGWNGCFDKLEKFVAS